MEDHAMFAGRKGCYVAILCAFVCLASPAALFAITMTFGAEQWRPAEEPEPMAAYVMDALFLTDLGRSVGLLCLTRGRWWYLAFIIAVPLLFLAGVIWLWGS